MTKEFLSILIIFIIIISLLILNYFLIETFDEKLPTLKYLEMKDSKKKLYKRIYEKFEQKSSLKSKVNIKYEIKSSESLNDDEKKYVDFKPQNKLQDWSSLLLLDSNEKLIAKYSDSPYVLKNLEKFVKDNLKL
jgi:hypothetical protein